MGCKISRTIEEDEFLIKRIGHVTRLPRPRNIASIAEEKKDDDVSFDDQGCQENPNIARMIKSKKNTGTCKLPLEVDSLGSLADENILRRISGSNPRKSISINGRNIGYAALTKQFNPDNISKFNQDANVIKHKIADDYETSFFGVFDGHGNEGHECATIAKKHIPKLIDDWSRRERMNAYESECASNDSKFVWNPKIFPALTSDQCKRICKKVQSDVNKAMHSNNDVSDKPSETTAIIAMIYGEWLTLCNTGDNHAVIGVVDKGNPQDSSSEAKSSHEKGEIDHIRNANARVLNLNQQRNCLPLQEQSIEQEINYDQNVQESWLSTHQYPGTGVKRSLGDFVAPEIITQ